MESSFFFSLVNFDLLNSFDLVLLVFLVVERGLFSNSVNDKSSFLLSIGFCFVFFILVFIVVLGGRY